MKPNPALRTWTILNDTLRSAPEAMCLKLLKDETAGKRRLEYLRRIHSRLNKVRADRERAELMHHSSRRP